MISRLIFLWPSCVFSLKRLFLLFFLCFSSLSGFACNLIGPECRHDLDCPTSSVCVVGLCRPAGQIVCQRDGSCPQGTRCSQGTCEPSGATCKTNADCPSTEECRVLVCQPKTPVACAKDADCPTGQTCKNKTCTPVTPACAKDGDCPTGQTCSNGTCAPVNPACTKDADCETGYRCEQGSCVPTAQNCKEDNHCLAGQICFAGTCQASGTCLPSKLSHTVATKFPSSIVELLVRKGGTELLDVNEASFRLRDATTGQWKRWWTFAPHGASPTVALSPSERWFVRAAADIKLWDLESEGPPQTLAVKASAVHLTDQTLFVLESLPGKSRLLRYSLPDLSLQKESLLPEEVTKQSTYSPAFAPKGTTFAFFTAEGQKGRVTIVDSDTMKILHTLLIPEAYRYYFAYQLGFSPTGRYLWATGNQGLLVWDLQTPAVAPTLLLQASADERLTTASRLTFHPQETHFVVSTLKGELRWFALPGAAMFKNLPLNLTKGVKLLRYTLDGQRFFLVTAEEAIYVLDTEGKFLPSLLEPKWHPLSVAFPLNRPEIIRSTTEDGILREWNLATQDFRVWVIPNDGKKTKNRNLLLSPDGRFLLDFFSKETEPGKSTEVVEQWELEPSPRRLRDLHTGPNYWPRVFSPDGRFFASPLPDRKIGIWDLHTGQALPLLDSTPVMPTPNNDSINSLAISPGASYLVASNSRGETALWDRKAGTSRPLHGSTSSNLGNFLFAPDGETFAGLTRYDRIDLFSSKTGAIQRSFEGLSGSYVRLAYTPDGAFLAADGGTGLITVWEVKTGKVVLTYSLGKNASGSSNSAYHLLFSSPGRRLLYAIEGEFSVWDCP